jgi:hemerythrin
MCSGQGCLKIILDEQHEQIFTKINELITACKTNFETEEKHGLCVKHISNHKLFIGKLIEFQEGLEKHIEEYDKGLYCLRE